MNQYVYLIHATGTNRYKIGHTRLVPSDRLKKLQTGSPVLLELITWREGDSKDETQLHRRFAEYRKTGEWFEFPSLDLVLRYFRRTSLAPPSKTIKVWDRDAVAREIAHQVTAHAMMMRDSEARRQFANVEISNLWYAVVDRFGLVGTRPKLTPEERDGLLQLVYRCQSM